MTSGGPARRFVILCPPRSGSNLLVQALNASSDGVTCYTELFNPTGRDMMAANPGYARPRVPYWRATGLAPLDYLRRDVWAKDEGCVGFKLMLGQSRTREAYAAARSLGARVIYLTRADKVRGVLSAALAKALRKWWHLDGVAWTPPASVKLAREHVEHFARVFGEEQNWAAANLPKDALSIRYEDFPQDLERAFHFLGFSGPAVMSGPAMPKRTPEDLWNRVANRAEMEALAESLLAKAAKRGRVAKVLGAVRSLAARLPSA